MIGIQLLFHVLRYAGVVSFHTNEPGMNKKEKNTKSKKVKKATQERLLFGLIWTRIELIFLQGSFDLYEN